MELTNTQKLQIAINKIVVSKNYIDVGVQFISEFYGVVTTLKQTPYDNGIYSIYGSDEHGDIRSEYFPKDLIWLGFKIDLELILQALSKKYTYFIERYDENTVRVVITNIIENRKSSDIGYIKPIFNPFSFNWKLSEGFEYQVETDKEIIYNIFK